LRTIDGGKTWEIQPNVTSNTLQAITYRGGTNLWVAGRGGTILKRSENLLTKKIVNLTKLPPNLKIRTNKNLPKLKIPEIPIADDGDIPRATQTPKPQK
jgi:hypothetical protein